MNAMLTRLGTAVGKVVGTLFQAGRDTVDMVIKNILLRMQANFERSPARQKELIAEADRLRDRAMELQAKANEAAGEGAAGTAAGTGTGSGSGSGGLL